MVVASGVAEDLGVAAYVAIIDTQIELTHDEFSVFD